MSCMGERRGNTGFGWGNLSEIDHLEDPGVDWMIIPRYSGSGMCGHGLDRAGSGQGHMAGTCECGNELSGSVICREFLD